MIRHTLSKVVTTYKSDLLFVALLLVISAIPRFTGLGYSHFYGDEIKTLYIDKTVSATDFFLTQRKGPVQFLVTWFVEKITGGYSEFWIRVPFALAGTLSILAFYLYVRKLCGKTAAIFSAILYSISGFSVAFSRTAQYQSFLMLFGFTALLFFEIYMSERKKQYLILAALFLSTAFLTHYDSIFFLIPILLNNFITITKSRNLRLEILKYFIFPVLLIGCTFYLPYVLKGTFSIDTINYLRKRLVGKEFLPNNSLYTLNVYNPGYIFVSLVLGCVFYGLLSSVSQARKLFIWFFVIFVVFEFVFQNPGTHILNYLIPVYILFGLLVKRVLTLPKQVRTAASLAICLVLVALYIISCFVFIPGAHQKYPWKTTKVGQLAFERPGNKYQLFLYGFPYNVGWDQVGSYMDTLKGVRGFFTNDNDSFGDFYMRKYPVTGPGTNFLPQYYIHVLYPQELQDRSDFLLSNKAYYDNINNIYVNNEKTIEIYQLVRLPLNVFPDKVNK